MCVAQFLVICDHIRRFCSRLELLDTFPIPKHVLSVEGTAAGQTGCE